MFYACSYAWNMKLLQIRNVPDDLHRRLKVRAASEGRSMSDIVLDEIRRALDRPTFDELSARVQARTPAAPGESPVDSVHAVRAERDAR
jgi:plasmid stability protein